MRIGNRSALVLLAFTGLGLGGCGSDDSPAADPGPVPLTVPKVATCSAGDKPESALQGQVPAALRQAGYAGFNCNLKLVGQAQGEGGNWSSATFVDGGGRTCAYHSTAAPADATGTPIPGRVNPGVPVIDITNRATPTRVSSLTTPAMLDPWESLRVNYRRQILIADNGQNGGGGPEVDIYDLSGDCRTPQLLGSISVAAGNNGGVTPARGPIGHEGNVAPDGLTYYIGDLRSDMYHAVDISNTTKPKLISSFDMRTGSLVGGRPHGLSVSNDGTRAYFVSLYGLPFNSPGEVSDPNAPLSNGFYIIDTSQVQARTPNAQMTVVAAVAFKDGTIAQHTIPATINGKAYLVMVDEGGSAGLADATNTNLNAACAANLSPFPLARIYDINNETQPKLASKLMLETHDPKNCAQVAPDVVGLTTFTYGSHYCSVDNRDNATLLVCGYMNSGIRAFDIRNPERPREIAYYNPGPTTGTLAGSNHFNRNQRQPTGPDWCASRVDFDFQRKQIMTMCQDAGMLVLQFVDGTWPFAQSTPSTSHN
jgi:hypothetical protein